MAESQRGWDGFGAYSLGGVLQREEPLRVTEQRIHDLESGGSVPHRGAPARLTALRAEWTDQARRIYAELEPWETVVVARHPHRPMVTDYISLVVDDFCEVHGDKHFGDDPAIITGFGMICDQRVMFIGHNRGKDLAERIACRFGCARPEGYRKAIAKMKLAAKFGIPIVTLIDTPGAYPGTESEERGIARAIAVCLAEMSRLPVPIVSVVTGEGGSGGALGLAIADRLAMFEHSVFSVISPEGCAAILYRTGDQAKEAASSLRLRARDLLELGLIDEVLGEPLGGAHRNREQAAQTLRRFVLAALREFAGVTADRLRSRRLERLRHMGTLQAVVQST